MKKSIFSKVGAAAVVLTLVTASLVGGTFAKYTTTATGTGTATVAKWAIAMKQNDTAISNNTFTFDLANTNMNAATASGKIGPESQGAIKMTIDGTGSEVGYAYDITFDTSGLGTVPVKFYSDAEMKTPLTYTDNKATMTGNVEQAAVDTAKDVTVYWKWDPDSTDAADTTLGESATAVTGTVAVTMTANQLIKTTPAP